MEHIRRIQGDSIHLVSVNGDEPRTLRSIGNGGGGGTKDYNALQNLPSINGTTVQGNKTLSDYGLTAEMSPALNGKVDKVSGKGLSSNDFTNADKSKLNGIEAGAEVNVNADWNAVSGDAQILNKPTIPTVPTDVSAFNNDAGYVNATQAANAAPVQSVNGSTGAVSLTIPTVPSDISAFNNDSGYVDATGAAAAAPVQSVNGATGAVTVTVPTKTSDLNNDSNFAPYFFGNCTDGGGNTTKTVSISGFTAADLVDGVKVTVRFEWNQVLSGTSNLNVSSTGAYPIYYNTADASKVNAWKAGDIVEFTFYNNKWYMDERNFLPDDTTYAGSSSVGGAATVSHGIPFAMVDGTSTSTAYTASISGITAYYDGLTIMLYNGKVTSAANFTIDINGLGALGSYSNMSMGNPVTPTTPTRDSTIWNLNYAMLFTYYSNIGGTGTTGWVMYRGYDSNQNTIGYQIRTNSMSMPMSSKVYRYRLLFESADRAHFVPANNSTSTNATSARTPVTEAINPFGDIRYYGATTALSAGDRPSVSNIWQQNTATIGYSFQKSPNYSLTGWHPVYLVCAPQSDGSAIIDSTDPITQTLPSTEDGKIYIHLGVAYSTTAIELTLHHPVYYYKSGAIRPWTFAV